MKFTVILLLFVVIVSVLSDDSKSSEEKKEKKRIKQLKKMYKDRVKYEKLLKKGKKYSDKPFNFDIEMNKITHHIHHINPGVTRPMFVGPPPKKIGNQEVYLDMKQFPEGLIHVQGHLHGQQGQYKQFGQKGQQNQYNQLGEMILPSKISQQYVPGGNIRPGKWNSNKNDMATLVLVNPEEQIGKQQHIVGQWGKQQGHFGQKVNNGGTIEVLKINKIPIGQPNRIENIHTVGHGSHHTGGRDKMEFIEIHKTASGKPQGPTHMTEIYKTIGGGHHPGSGGSSAISTGKQWELQALQPQEIKQIYYKEDKSL